MTRETDAQRVQRAAQSYVRDRIELRRSCEVALDRAAVVALGRLTVIMFQKPDSSVEGEP